MGFHHDKPVAAIADSSMSQPKVLLETKETESRRI